MSCTNSCLHVGVIMTGWLIMANEAKKQPSNPKVFLGQADKWKQDGKHLIEMTHSVFGCNLLVALYTPSQEVNGIVCG